MPLRVSQRLFHFSWHSKWPGDRDQTNLQDFFTAPDTGEVQFPSPLGWQLYYPPPWFSAAPLAICPPQLPCPQSVLNSANQSHHSLTYWANPLSSFNISHHPLCSSSNCSSPIQSLRHFLTCCCSLCLKCSSLRSAFCHLVLRFVYCLYFEVN